MSWKLAMPAAENWQQLTDQLDFAEPTIDHETGEGMVAIEGDGRGMRWMFDEDTLERVATVLGVKFTCRVGDPREFIHGYGNITYAQVKFNYLPMLHDDKSPGTFAYVISVYPMLSPEAANYCIWHEIQHIFQFEEMRAHPMKMDYNPNLPMLGDNVEKYMKDPTETDADAMALKLHQLGQYQVVRTISWLEGTEGEEYAMLVNDEGWPPDEAAEEVQTQIKTNEIPLSKVMETRGLEPLEAPISKVAMPYFNNTWYHVTSVDYLDNIAKVGLAPRQESQQSTNWPQFSVAQNAVYMWPTIAMARSYFGALPFKQREVILRITNIDQSKLAPDHEAFSSWLEERWYDKKNGDENDYDNEAIRIYDQILETVPEFARYLDEEEKELGEVSYMEITHEDALEILAKLPAKLRIELVEYFAEVDPTAPVMYYGTVAPEDIAVASLLTLDELEEKFNEESQHPYLQEFDEEHEQDYYEKLDQYLVGIMDERQIHEFISIEDLERAVQEAYEDEADELSQHFQYHPLPQWTQDKTPVGYGDARSPWYIQSV